MLQDFFGLGNVLFAKLVFIDVCKIMGVGFIVSDIASQHGRLMHLLRVLKVHQMEEWSFVQPKVDIRRRKQIQEMQGWKTVNGKELPVGDEKKS